MLKSSRSTPPREIARWGVYALLLLAPGSFVVLPLLWLARTWASRATRPAPIPGSRHAGALVHAIAPVSMTRRIPR